MQDRRLPVKHATPRYAYDACEKQCFFKLSAAPASGSRKLPMDVKMLVNFSILFASMTQRVRSALVI